MQNFHRHTIFREPFFLLGTICTFGKSVLQTLQNRKTGLEMGISVLAALALLFWVPQMSYALEVCQARFQLCIRSLLKQLIYIHPVFDPVLKTDLGPRHTIPFNSCCPASGTCSSSTLSLGESNLCFPLMTGCVAQGVTDSLAACKAAAC